MIGMDVGNQNQIRLRQPVKIPLAPRINVNHLPPSLNHHAGMPDRRNLDDSRLGLELLNRPGALRKSQDTTQQKVTEGSHHRNCIKHRTEEPMNRRTPLMYGYNSKGEKKYYGSEYAKPHSPSI